MHEVNDTILVEHIRQGREQAFRELYDRYHRQMYYIAKKYVKDASLAEDAVQDIFVKVWEKRDSLDPSKSIKGYLFTLLKNHVLNMIRDRKKQIVSVSDVPEGEFPQKNSTDEEMVYNEYQDIVERGLEQLTDRKREVFELKVNGHSNAQVAEMLHISVRTVKTHYYNGSKFIRTYLKNHANIFLILMAVSLSLLFL